MHDQKHTLGTRRKKCQITDNIIPAVAQLVPVHPALHALHAPFATHDPATQFAPHVSEHCKH